MLISSVEQAKEVLNANGVKLYTFDHNVSYDTWMSQHNFDDFKSEWQKQSLWLGDRNETDYIVFFASEKLMSAPYYKKSQLAKMRKQALYDLCEEYEILNYNHSEYEIEDNTKQTLIAELMQYIDNEKYYTHHYNESAYRDLDYDFDITGYSQGDKVLIKTVGTKKDFKESDLCYLPESDYLTNIFYDTPIYGRIDINLNGEEIETFNFFEMDDFNEYDYFDKDKILSLIENHFSGEEYLVLLMEYLKDNLETTLDYK